MRPQKTVTQFSPLPKLLFSSVTWKKSKIKVCYVVCCFAEFCLFPFCIELFAKIGALRAVPTNSKVFLRGFLNMREKQILTSVIEIQKEN